MTTEQKTKEKKDKKEKKGKKEKPKEEQSKTGKFEMPQYCPFLMIGNAEMFFFSSEKTSKVNTLECKQQLCKLWDEDDDTCAIEDIAISLAMLSSEVNDDDDDDDSEEEVSTS